MGFNIPSSAQINWETLALHDMVQSDGYVEILVANESDVPTFFDNIHVTLEESMIVQESHFYPYGMQMRGIGKTPMLENRWAGYNEGASEKQKDLVGKGYMLETDFRPYDPQLGRFTLIDPFADSFTLYSPYHFAFDNPIQYNDPLGLDFYYSQNGDKSGYIWQEGDAETIEIDGVTYRNTGTDRIGIEMSDGSVRWEIQNEDGKGTHYEIQESNSETPGDVVAGSGDSGGAIPLSISLITLEKPLIISFVLISDNGFSENQGKKLGSFSQYL